MERKNHYIMLILALIGFIPLSATQQIDNNRTLAMYDCYIEGNMLCWKAIIDQMEYNKMNQEDFLMELINYQYGYIAYCIANKNKSEAKRYLKKANQNLATLQAISTNAELKAYESMFLGFEIGLNRFKAPILGMRSKRLAEEALKENPNNVMILMCNGFIMYYAPSVIGGNKEKAFQFFTKADRRLDIDFPDKKNWNYLNILTNIGLLYEKEENIKLAKQYYERIIEMEPNYQFVKQELYPSILKRYKSN